MPQLVIGSDCSLLTWNAQARYRLGPKVLVARLGSQKIRLVGITSYHVWDTLLNPSINDGRAVSAEPGRSRRLNSGHTVRGGLKTPGSDKDSCSSYMTITRKATASPALSWYVPQGGPGGFATHYGGGSRVVTSTDPRRKSLFTVCENAWVHVMHIICIRFLLRDMLLCNPFGSAKSFDLSERTGRTMTRRVGVTTIVVRLLLEVIRRCSVCARTWTWRSSLAFCIVSSPRIASHPIQQG